MSTVIHVKSISMLAIHHLFVGECIHSSQITTLMGERMHAWQKGGGILTNLLGLPADADHCLDRRDGILALHKTSIKHQIRGSRVWLQISSF
jgi:hypothetical protein